MVKAARGVKVILNGLRKVTPPRVSMPIPGKASGAPKAGMPRVPSPKTPSVGQAGKL